MRKGFRNFCHGVGSTSTLKQKPSHEAMYAGAPSLAGDSYVEESNAAASPLTLEQMILQLDMEEEAARRAKLDDCSAEAFRRMSCVNNSDILRSARNALNQYPRFSLDGKDAMYRSSFCNYGTRLSAYEGGHSPACCRNGVTGRSCRDGHQIMGAEKSLKLPATLAGESVVWCKPGVVARLMGLDAVPVPVPVGRRQGKKAMNPMADRKHYLRRLARLELERERLYVSLHGGCNGSSSRESVGSCSRTGYCMMNPSPVEPARGSDDWRFRRAC